MKVYIVSVNTQDFRRLELSSDYDLASRLPIIDNAKPVDWNPPVAQYVDEHKPLADFMALGDNAIVYDAASIEPDIDPYSNEYSIVALAEMASYGAYAQVAVDNGQRLNVLVVTESCNALDTERTIWRESDDGKTKTIEKFVFHTGRLGTQSGLFRLALPELDAQYVFAYSSEDESEEEFLKRYSLKNMSGLVFTEVWSE